MVLCVFVLLYVRLPISNLVYESPRFDFHWSFLDYHGIIQWNDDSVIQSNDPTKPIIHH